MSHLWTVIVSLHTALALASSVSNTITVCSVILVVDSLSATKYCIYLIHKSS